MWPSGGNAEGLWRLLEDGARPCPGARGLLAGPARRHRAPTQGGGHTQRPRSTVGDPEAPQFPGLLKTDTKSSMQVIFPAGQKVPSNPGTQVAGVVATWGAARSLASPNSSWPLLRASWLGRVTDTMGQGVALLLLTLYWVPMVLPQGGAHLGTAG